MKHDTLPEQWVYSPPVIEFVKASAETCLLLEQASEHQRHHFVEKCMVLLPLLYLKATVLRKPEKIFIDDPERFVTEADYNDVKEGIQQLLGEQDSYLDTFHPDMPFSDTPIAAFISENLADIYQEIKDCAANYQLGVVEIKNDALCVCKEEFAYHWGQKLLNALKALHQLHYAAMGNDETTNDEVSDRNSNPFQHKWSEEESD